MKHFSKLLTALLLALVIVFNTVACDTLAELPGFDKLLGGEDTLDSGVDETNGEAPDEEPDVPSDEQGGDTPECQHTLTEIRNVKDATCTDTGYSGDKVCLACGVTLKRGVETYRVDHSYSDGKCEMCGKDEPVVPPVVCTHSNIATEGKKDATCTDTGYTGDVVCVTCGMVVTEGEKIERLTHVYVDGICSACGEVDPDYKPEYVFGSEYADLIITVAEARELAEQYSSSASSETYYILVKIDDVVSLKNGNMYVSDDTGSIYVYGAKDKDGYTLSGTNLKVGDLAVIAGPLRNYKGELEIEKGRVLDYYTPGETPTPPGENPGDGPDTPGGEIIWPTPDDPIISDPYENVDKDAFYADYRPAVSYMDAYYRSKHYLMSGSIEKQDQAPTVSDYQPMIDGKYVRNTTYLFSADGNTYYVVNAYGEVVNEIYKGGAYVTLEEVAAYVFAFGAPPANHSSNKNASPTSSQWGIYLRVNHSNFSGSTSKYPYEPELPNISGCGGDLYYYEMDIGTTGTDCDPSYEITDYNNGSKIVRGAARIVYAKTDLDRDGVIEVNETYLFYTYNHYNDFQEYLNYEGGWGEMFGNITGGGTLSSKYNYNPTDYPVTAYEAFVISVSDSTYEVVVIALLPTKEEV